MDVRLTIPPEPGPGSRWRTDKVATSTNTNAKHSLNNSSSAASLGKSSGSLASGERNLLAKRARLIEQLERLVKTLPDDLRNTLQLKTEAEAAKAAPTSSGAPE